MCFGSPDYQPAPAPPPQKPQEDIEASNFAAAQERKRRSMSGRSSTMLAAPNKIGITPSGPKSFLGQ